MESRRIILLTKGYIDGLLDFKYKTFTSRAREEYILALIEGELFKKVNEVRSLVYSSIASGIPKQEIIKLAIESFENYENMTLPYVTKELRMKENEINKQKLDRIREIHEKSKVAFEKLKEQRKAA